MAVGMLPVRNRNEPSKGNLNFMPTFPSLYSCNEQSYMDRLFSFILPGSSNTGLKTIKPITQVLEMNKPRRVPEKMAED